MEEDWEQIEEFPDCFVSTLGEIHNVKTKTPRRRSYNQQGIAKVTFYQDRMLYTRAVAVIVATAFVPRPNEYFDTPIHLDGDRQNCRADNLLWRPRGFAINYHRQFMLENFHMDRTPLVDAETGEEYPGLKEVCVSNGVYWFDVIKSDVEGSPTFPDGKVFRQAKFLE